LLGFSLEVLLVSAYLSYVENEFLLCLFMLLYVWSKYEHLYRGLASIKKRDMSENRHIVHGNNRTTVKHKYRRKKRMPNSQKEAQTKLMKGLLDLIVLQLLNQQPMHGYQIITRIRKSFGVYFGPSTIYPLLGTLEKKGHVRSVWNMDAERPRKVYRLTNEGQNLLNFTEESLNLICRRINITGTAEVTVATATRTALKPLMRNSE
jgi:PadR family transcriptional regulator